MLGDEAATVRRMETIERSVRELGPSVAESFKTTVANILGIKQGIQVTAESTNYSAATGWVASPTVVSLTIEGTRLVSVDTICQVYLQPGLNSGIVVQTVLFIDGQIIADDHPALINTPGDNPGWLGGTAGVGISSAGTNITYQITGSAVFSILPGAHTFQLYRRVTPNGPNTSTATIQANSVRVLVNLYSDSNS